MKINQKQFAGLMFGLATAALPLSALAETWNMPTPYAEGNFHTQNIKTFAEEVKEKTGGEIDIKVHSAGSLFKLPEIKRAVQSGQVPIGETLMSSLANEDALFEATNVPFLAKGYDKAATLWGLIGGDIAERLEGHNLTLLFAAPWPSQGVYTAEPVDSVEGFAGLKIRTYDRPTSRYAELMEAVPVTVQAAEIPQAFATGIVQAMITSATTGADTKAWEYVNYYHDFSAMISRNIVVVNSDKFNSLDAETQKILMDAGAAALERATAEAMRLEEASKVKLTENGVEIVAPSAEMSAAMDEIGQQLVSEWAERAGLDGEKIVTALRD